MFDVMYDSRRALGMYYRYCPRNLLAIVNRTVSGDFVRELAIDESKSVLPVIHESVLQRIDGGGQDYLPLTLPHRFFVWHTEKEENNETDHIEVLSQLATEQDENNKLANLDKEIRNNRNYRKSFWRGFFFIIIAAVLAGY